MKSDVRHFRYPRTVDARRITKLDKPGSKQFNRGKAMDKTTAVIIALGILALVFIAFFAVFRGKGTGKIKGPFGMGIDVEGANNPDSPVGVRVKDARAGGNLRAQDATGRGVDAQKLRAAGDIELGSSGGGAPAPPKE